MEVALGFDVTPKSLGAALIHSKSKWDEVDKFVKAVLSRKDADEREIQVTQATHN